MAGHPLSSPVAVAYSAQYRQRMFFHSSKRDSPQLRPELERFREAVAEASFEGELAGYFSVQVGAHLAASGPWWRRELSDPRWGIAWTFFYEPAFDESHPRVGPPYEDGFELGDESVFDELLGGSVDVRGRVYSLRWIDRASEPELWADNYGYMPAKPGVGIPVRVSRVRRRDR